MSNNNNNDNHKTRPFPFGNDGPPNKKERQFVSIESCQREVEGFMPTIALSFFAELRSKGIKRLPPILVAMMLYREKKLAEKPFKGKPQSQGWLRLTAQTREDLGITSASHTRALKELEAAGVIELAESPRGFVARLLVNAEPETVARYKTKKPTEQPTRADTSTLPTKEESSYLLKGIGKQAAG